MQNGGLRRFDTSALATLLICSLMAALPANAKDVRIYKVSKGIHYQQTGPGAPAVLMENGYVFQANVYMPLPGTVRGATVRSQEGTVRTLESVDDDELEFRNRVNTKATLETRYPDGNFRFTMDTVNDGNKTPVLQLLGNSYPPAPHISNFYEVQNANGRGYLIVTWDALPGGNWADFIQLRVENAAGERVFETPDLGEAGALDGTATYAVLDPTRLKPGTVYEATLRFEKSVGRDETSYIGTLGLSTYHSLTRFSIVTSNAGEPNVQSYSVAKGRDFKQETAGAPVADSGDEYRFQATVEGSYSNAVLNATVRPPGGEALVLAPDKDKEQFDLTDSETDITALNSKFPNGFYSFGIQTAEQGTLSPGLTLNGDLYPPAPHVQFDPSVQVRSDQDLVIVWDAWPDGTANDYVQLRVEELDDDNVFETPDFGENRALNGRSTFAIIPKGKFKQGTTYKARLVFRRFTQLDTASFPGSLGMASYFSRLKFNISTLPPDIRSFAVTKGVEYRQSSTNMPALVQYVFQASVSPATTMSVSGASITTPLGAVVPLMAQNGGATFALFDTRASQAALDAVYPDGNYVLTVNAVNDGVRTFPVTLNGATYPNPPRIREFDYAGQMEPWFDIVFSWDPFEAGNENDSIQFELRWPGGVPAFRSEGLIGFDHDTFIPSDMLMSSTMYAGSLRFEKVLPVDMAGYPQLQGRASYFARTRFNAATIGPGNPPAINNLQLLPNGDARLSFESVWGGTYQIEGSRDLKTWTPLGTVTASDYSASFTMPRPAPDVYFLRAHLLR